MKKLIKNDIDEVTIDNEINSNECSHNILESKIDRIFGEIFVEKDINKIQSIFNEKNNEYKKNLFEYIKFQKKINSREKNDKQKNNQK
ncbi:MAG: hypothetical protein ACRCW6_02675 [Mycoplasmoidaceae bacterium]